MFKNLIDDNNSIRKSVGKAYYATRERCRSDARRHPFDFASNLDVKARRFGPVTGA